MKSKFLSIFIFIFMLFSLVGCAGEMGPQGPQGEQGIQGEDGHTPIITIGENGNWYIDGVDTGVCAEGSKGETGEQGIQGEVGPQGPQGPQGQQGEQGLSAYEIFLKYYPEYKGTEQEWIIDVAMGNTCNLFGHSWDEGVITTEPTKGNEGEKTYSCSNCDEHKYEVLPKIEIADAEIYEIDGVKYVNYGSYPQTHVGDADLIAELNKLTTTNSRGYYEYNGNEYAKVTTNPYNYGTTSSTDKYGNVQYYTYTYSDGTTINRNVVEWFKVEPIKWRIIAENADGSYELYSEYILDATRYCDYEYVRSIDGNDVYRNNYKYSNIRAWLNGYNGTDYKITDYTNKGFYNLAFKDNEKGAIVTKEVDNSASTTSSSTNSYACENTFDKIYLLSYKDVYNSNYGFTNGVSRCAKVTDYAKAVGAYWNTSSANLNNGYYWLRSPYGSSSDYAYCVRSDGSVDSDYGVDTRNYGVRVACIINLE